MKQVININFQGRVVPIEVSAYEMLKNYIESLSRHFAAEQGKDEIINDIENRIGELFQERIKNGATCITDEDVEAIIRSIGRPEDFESDEPVAAGGANNSYHNTSDQQQQSSSFAAGGGKRLFRDENHKLVGGVCSGVANYFGIDIVVVRIVFLLLLFFFGFGFIPYIILWIAVPSSASATIGSMRKKMYRDTDDKWIGGVCSGLAHYFGVNVWIPRILFLIPFLSFAGRWAHWGRLGDFPDFLSFGFSPGAMFFYIILWLVLPEANSTAEKLEMKGEKVDMNSIKKSVAAEMRGVQERAKKFGKEAASFASDKGKTFGTDAAVAAKRGSRSLGDVIVFLVKLFGYFILGVVGFALVAALFGFGIAAIGIFPMKDFVLTQGWQTALAWGTLVMFIIIPMLGVITWIIRKLAKIRTGSKMLRLFFSAIWVAGLICFIFLFASVSKDFREESDVNEQEVYLSNPSVNSLEVTTQLPGRHYVRNNWFSFDPYEWTDEDTAFVRNISVHIIKAPNDSFKVTMIKLACGQTKRYADTLAGQMRFNAMQSDSTLIIDRAIPINKTDKFRNQRIILTVYVPVGKQIMINRNVGWSNDIRFIRRRNNGDWGSIQTEGREEQGWDEGKWYNMTAKGLYTLDGKPADEYDNDDDESVHIDSRGIHVKDKNTDVHVSGSGVTVTEDGNDDDDSGRYRYKNDQPAKPDTMKGAPAAETKRYKDSLKQEMERLDKLIKKTDGKAAGGTAYMMLPGHDPVNFLN